MTLDELKTHLINKINESATLAELLSELSKTMVKLLRGNNKNIAFDDLSRVYENLKAEFNTSKFNTTFRKWPNAMSINFKGIKQEERDHFELQYKNKSEPKITIQDLTAASFGIKKSSDNSCWKT